MNDELAYLAHLNLTCPLCSAKTASLALLEQHLLACPAPPQAKHLDPTASPGGSKKKEKKENP